MINNFHGLEKVKYKIFDKEDSTISHLYSPISEQDEHEILRQLNAKKLALLSQEHGENVCYVDESYRKSLGDAMVTDKPGIILGIQTADCVCAMLASSDKKVIAAIHLGWKGAASNLLQNTVAMMRQSSGAEIFAIISPCIRQESYEVDGVFKSNFIDKRPNSISFFKINDEKLYFDLPGFVKEDLKQNGITRIRDDNHDTYTSEKFFSFRLSKHRNIEEKRRLLSCLTIVN
jgi:YfiH family protein